MVGIQKASVEQSDLTSDYLGIIKPHSHPSDFYWGHQCSWILTSENSMKVFKVVLRS